MFPCSTPLQGTPPKPLFKPLREVALAIETHLLRHFANTPLRLLRQQESSFFQALEANVLGRGHPDRIVQLAVQVCPAHANQAEQFIYIEGSIGKVFLDLKVEPWKEYSLGAVSLFHLIFRIKKQRQSYFFSL